MTGVQELIEILKKGETAESKKKLRSYILELAKELETENKMLVEAKQKLAEMNKNDAWMSDEELLGQHDLLEQEIDRLSKNETELLKHISSANEEIKKMSRRKVDPNTGAMILTVGSLVLIMISIEKNGIIMPKSPFNVILRLIKI